jgi:hypothetical protein
LKLDGEVKGMNAVNLTPKIAESEARAIAVLPEEASAIHLMSFFRASLNRKKAVLSLTLLLKGL